MTGDAQGPRVETPLPIVIGSRREYRCAVCGAEFTSRQQMDEHDRIEHGVP
jgi:hypothetical protein